MMTQDEFIKEMQHYRGGLESQKEIDAMIIIHKYGVPRLLNLTLTKKQFGVKNTSLIALHCPKAQQEDFCDWLETKNWKATKNEIELYFSS